LKKLILIGRVAAGKTTLMQALKGEQLSYCKTQYVYYTDTIIDTPGEYTENGRLASALALYTYEADVVGLLISSNYPYNPFPPNCTTSCNRDVIGLVTGVDKPDGNPERVERWLRLAGCKTVFHISSYTGEGIRDVIAYLDDGTDEKLSPEHADRAESTFPERNTVSHE
jgi:ethanolamine utilization protein EutP